MIDVKIRSKRILIVEDDEDMLEIYRNMFDKKKDKYQIETVTDARLGFKKLEEGEFDLVILDIIMEPMPGDTFFLCVRNDKKLRNVPVIVVSVLDPNDMIGQFKKVNHVGFLQKPITEDQLFEKVDQFAAG